MAQMIDIDDFVPEVLRYSPNTSDIVAQRFLLQAARELCDRAKLWRETDEIQVSDPDRQGVSTISDASIVGIEEAWMGGAKLEPQAISWLDRNRPGWAFGGDLDGAPQFVTQLEPNTLTVVPYQTGTLKVRLLLKPSRNALSMPAFLLEQYAEELGRGAAGRILTDPTSENPALGVGHLEWFENRIAKLSHKAARGQHGAPLRSRGASF